MKRQQSNGAEGGLSAAPIYWINLDERTDRFTAMLQKLEHWNGATERIQATPARVVSDADLALYLEVLPERIRRKRVGDAARFNPRAEIACLRSHVRALRTGVARGVWPFTVVEDDVILPDGWANAPLPSSWDLLILGGNPHLPEVPPPVQDGWLRVEEMAVDGCYCYAVGTERAALTLLSLWALEAAPVDMAWWEAFPVLEAYVAIPSRARHDFVGASSINRRARATPPVDGPVTGLEPLDMRRISALNKAEG